MIHYLIRNEKDIDLKENPIFFLTDKNNNNKRKTSTPKRFRNAALVNFQNEIASVFLQSWIDLMCFKTLQNPNIHKIYCISIIILLLIPKFST